MGLILSLMPIGWVFTIYEWMAAWADGLPEERRFKVEPLPFATGTRFYWRTETGEDVSAISNKNVVRIDGTETEFDSQQAFFEHLGSGAMVRVNANEAKGGPYVASRVGTWYGTWEPNGMLKVN